MDQQVKVCLCLRMSFQVLTQLEGCTNSSRKERNGSGGQLRSIDPIYSSWGAAKGKTSNCEYISRLLSGQGAKMGFHICIVGYVFGIPLSLLWEALSNSGYFCPVPTQHLST